MLPIVPRSSDLKLSICIPTFNRATFIGATLESILAEVTDECEVVVLDGGSTDNTAEVVSEFTSRFDRLRYIRQEKNNGFDRDCNRAVEIASGEYCWLASDDDLLKPGVMATVLEALRRGPSLVVVNVEFKTFDMLNTVQHRWLNIESDRTYPPDAMDRLVVELGGRLLYVGGIVIKRAIWLTRDKERYFGSYFIYVGVIFQERLPGEAIVLAEPFISFRTDNSHAWSQHVLEIVWVKWPAVVWSLALSDSAKGRVCRAEPWKNCQELLVWRGLDRYSMIEYRKLIRPRMSSSYELLIPTVVALIPGVLVNAVLVLYFSVSRRTFQGWRQAELMLQDLRGSRFHFRRWFFNRESH